MSVRYNVEISDAVSGEDTTQGWLTAGQVKALVDAMEDGDALVVNAVQGPGAGEI